MNSKNRKLSLFLGSCAVIAISSCSMINDVEVGLPAKDVYWQQGKEELSRRLQVKPNERRAKNVILFIGDGMGISTITAARIFDGQSRGKSGEEHSLSFEQFPSVALVKTYNADSQVPDSAGTASAINTGSKTRRGAIGTWAWQGKEVCNEVQPNYPMTIAEYAEKKGISTGIVTTARVTHATPAAVYGHAPRRSWEAEVDNMPMYQGGHCKDLAYQMINFDYGDGLDVVLGGGRRAFLPVSEGGIRKDKSNLIKVMKQGHGSAEYVDSVSSMSQVVLSESTQVLGLFADSHMPFETDRSSKEEPSLSDMTSFSIDLLSKRERGFFLMVEGGRIDHAHHDTNAFRALSETQEFSKAIQVALDKVDLDETLILVTADHSHVFTIAGYPARGNPILGLVRPIDSDSQLQAKTPSMALDGKPYTTLGYHSGHYQRKDSRRPLTEKVVREVDFHQEAAIPLPRETHGGEDVALFAIGPQSQVVGGVIEQQTIFHIIYHAFGW